MAFTYDFVNAPAISFVRLLVPDTDALNPIFQDDEILAFMQINQMTWQSSMFYSYTAGSTNLPQSPSNYLRAAALALNSLAGNSSRLAGVVKILDVQLDLSKAATALRDTAARYLEMDDNSGAFAIAEQVNTVWAYRDRWLSQLQRQLGGTSPA